ncbi:MAG: ATP-binding protein [Candidatus Marsarchaeota archaeon]|nr:ATP-binding protein [Candidatus Marsarchaeota archaeon]
MDKELLKVIIKEQAAMIDQKLSKEHIIERDAKLNEYLTSNIALFILGVRRSGKSTLAMQLFNGQKYGYINFDDERLFGMKANDLNSVLQAFYELYGSNLNYIILDEVQNVKSWEPFVSRLREVKRVIVTGSNSKLLSGELATRLTGRHIDFTLYPFSFSEFLRYKNVSFGSTLTTQERANVNKLLLEYLHNGGFPEFFKYGRASLESIYNDIINRDIIQRHKIKHAEALRQIARLLISNSSQEFTYSSLKNITPIKNQITIANWVKYMEDAYLIFSVERFSYKLKNIAIAPKKGFAIDTGLVNLLGFSADKNFSRLMETCMAIELRRRSVDGRNFSIFYWKDHKQREVDFIIKSGDKVDQLIQVTNASSIEEVKEREIENIINASKDLHCSNLLIITLDYEANEHINGKAISFVPLWKWLLK